MINREIFFFGIAGASGFAVDWLFFEVFYGVLDWHSVVARFGSFGIAVVVTWLINRNHTFAEATKQRRGEPLLKEFLHYLASQSVGVGINMTIFFLLFNMVDVMKAYPGLPLAIASIVAAVFNFVVSKFFVFKVQR